jgi:molecular chaperone DnaK (HSP70)
MSSFGVGIDFGTTNSAVAVTDGVGGARLLFSEPSWPRRSRVHHRCSSLVPAVQRILARRFGAERLVGGEELTSVAWGLAISAARL